MKKLESALLATTLAISLALAGGSAYAADLAAPTPGVVTEAAPSGYVSVFGGYAFGTSVHSHSTSSAFDVSEPFLGGYVLGAAIGTHFTPNLRGELELSYSSHAADSAPFATGGGTATGAGSLSTLYFMGNVWYDIDTGSGFTPYIGGGIGVADIMPNLTLDGGLAAYKTNAFGFAGQLGAGVKFNLADNLSLDLGYRLRDVLGASMKGSPGSTITNVNYLDQSVQAGLQFNF